VPLFVDTVYWLALVNRNDTWHARAVEWAGRLQEPLVTTEAVLTEVADALCRRDRRRRAIEILTSVSSDPQITSVPGSAELFARAVDLYRDRGDKDWSLTDCTSFVVMNDRGLGRALTADAHFVQAGFRALLRE
jgi:predicted nucleic acid-binding protein